MKINLQKLISNWGLKILALVLAIVVYYAIKDSIRQSGQSSNSSFIKGATPNARIK